MARKLTIQTGKKPALVINQNALDADRLVYFAVANKKFKYRYGRSRIVYIGTTQKGAARIASSAASKANDLLSLHGVTHLEFYVVTCARRQRVKTWRKLERGLLLTFRELYGEIPKCNSQGSKMKWTDEQRFFTQRRLKTTVQKYS